MKTIAAVFRSRSWRSSAWFALAASCSSVIAQELDFPPVRPSTLGYSPKAIDELESTLAEWVKEKRIVGGELLIVADGRTLLHSVAGFADIESGRTMKRNTLFRIQSMTKTLLGTAVQLLREADKIDLDAPASSYVPELRATATARITVRHLLTHTAGLDYEGYNQEVWNREHPTRMHALKQLIAHGPMYEPGARFSYENGNSDMLAEVVTRAADQSAEQFLKEQLFAPLGMVDTGILAPPPEQRADRYASVYRRDGHGFRKVWDAGKTLDEAFYRGAGGAYSTVTDYARFLTMWMGGGRVGRRRYLEDETVREAITATAESRAAENLYGQHWQIFAEPPDSRLVFGHGGSDGTIAVAVPKLRIVMCYFTQTRYTDTTREMLALVAGALSQGGESGR